MFTGFGVVKRPLGDFRRVRLPVVGPELFDFCTIDTLVSDVWIMISFKIAALTALVRITRCTVQ